MFNTNLSETSFLIYMMGIGLFATIHFSLIIILRNGFKKEKKVGVIVDEYFMLILFSWGIFLSDLFFYLSVKTDLFRL